MSQNYLDSAHKQFEYYQLLGVETFKQLPDDALFWQPTTASNSISIIVNHLWGNMLSRWTDFLTTDGEKSWRQRDLEFTDVIKTREELIEKWAAGWDCVYAALSQVNESNFDQLVYIRNLGHTIPEVINRQLCHYAYHIGQIVYIGRMYQNEQWKSLSIPKGKSTTYNAEKFKQEKRRGHFSDEFLKKK